MILPILVMIVGVLMMVIAILDHVKSLKYKVIDHHHLTLCKTKARKGANYCHQCGRRIK